MTLRYIINIIASAAVILAGGIISGCGSSKNVAKPANTVASSAAVSRPDCDKALEQYSMQWSKLRLPLNLRLSKPASFSASGTAVMERGKSVTLSFKVFGMEVAVIKLTSDSILAIDKFHKRYVSEPLAPLLAGFPVDIDNMQDLLTGRPFLLGSTNPIIADAGKYDIDASAGDPVWTMIPKSMPAQAEYGFSFDSLLNLVECIVKCGSKPPVEISYGPAQMTVAGPFAPSLQINATAGETAIDGSITWNIGKIKLNSDVETRDVGVPGGKYERIPASKLLKSISNF